MTATTQPGITLEDLIASAAETMRLHEAGRGLPYWNDRKFLVAQGTHSSLIRLREIEGKLREPSEEMERAGAKHCRGKFTAMMVWKEMGALLLRGKP